MMSDQEYQEYRDSVDRANLEAEVARSMELNHDRCDNAWKPVQCDRCKRRYTCSPTDDLYCTDVDHCCESCLLTEWDATEMITLAPIEETP